MWEMVAWMLGIGVSVAALVLTAALKLGNPDLAYLHMAIAAVVSIAMALAARRELRADAHTGASASTLASTGLRYLGLIWTWAALALFVTYAFILQWREWWHFMLVFTLLAGLCLFLSATLRKDADARSDDETMLKLARALAMVHLGAGLITMVGLLVDGKMVRFLVPRHHDWAAQNIFFFGALALAWISWSALASMKAKRG